MFWIPNFTDEVKKFVWWLWDTIQQLLAQPNAFMNLPVTEYFVGNSAGIATRVAFYVFAAVMMIAVFIRRKRQDAAISLLTMLVSIVIIPVWFFMARIFIDFGDVLKRLALLLNELPEADQSSNVLNNITLPIVPVDQAIVTLFFALMLALAGLQLLIVMVAYEFSNVLIVALGIIVYAMSGIGENTRKFFSLLLSIFLVTGVIGLPVILFLTQFAQMLNDVVVGDSNLTGSILFLFLGALAGLILQPVMVWYAYKRVDRVVGSVVARIQDKVRSVNENKHRLDAHLAGAERSTMSYRFRMSMANAINAPIDKFDSWKSDKAALITKRISDAADRFKSNGSDPSQDGSDTPIAGPSRAEVAATAIAGTGAIVSKVVPHPAAKVAVSVGSAALNKLILKVGNSRTPHAQVRS